MAFMGGGEQKSLEQGRIWSFWLNRCKVMVRSASGALWSINATLNPLGGGQNLLPSHWWIIYLTVDRWKKMSGSQCLYINQSLQGSRPHALLSQSVKLAGLQMNWNYPNNNTLVHTVPAGKRSFLKNLDKLVTNIDSWWNQILQMTALNVQHLNRWNVTGRR